MDAQFVAAGSAIQLTPDNTTKEAYVGRRIYVSPDRGVSEMFTDSAGQEPRITLRTPGQYVGDVRQIRTNATTGKPMLIELDYSVPRFFPIQYASVETPESALATKLALDADTFVVLQTTQKILDDQAAKGINNPALQSEVYRIADAYTESQNDVAQSGVLETYEQNADAFAGFLNDAWNKVFGSGIGSPGTETTSFAWGEVSEAAATSAYPHKSFYINSVEYQDEGFKPDILIPSYGQGYPVTPGVQRDLGSRYYDGEFGVQPYWGTYNWGHLVADTKTGPLAFGLGSLNRRPRIGFLPLLLAAPIVTKVLVAGAVATGAGIVIYLLNEWWNDSKLDSSITLNAQTSELYQRVRATVPTDTQPAFDQVVNEVGTRARNEGYAQGKKEAQGGSFFGNLGAGIGDKLGWAALAIGGYFVFKNRKALGIK